MERQHLMILGLIGSLMAIVGVFLSWASVSAYGYSASSSGWDIATAETGAETYPYVALAGGIIGLIGSLGVFGMMEMPIKNLLPLGGIVAIVGAGWGLADLMGTEGVDIGLGVYVCLIGGVLALLSSLSLKGKTPV
ncbi:hypothetical protein AKJ65_03295 [candidate division MSBL1 archaeon SCGC-AAA259E19]|uniref:Uncharacterized protein n=1 Tax=candidate division MSBL1 archaeon SCGC-AAA259E19 TaxID=1698264 RepID=A0A133UKZ9_9EURY|nr:hypothetical protein AKJ65_03295 [candidate division MSBL1 archaeon SCGC-AAA259E19]